MIALRSSWGRSGAPRSSPLPGFSTRRTPHGRTANSMVDQITRETMTPGAQPTATSDLFELDQRARESLGMQEQHGLVVGADLGLAVAQHARALRLELVAGGVEGLDLVADVVAAAVGIARQEIGNGRFLAEGM